MANAADKVFEIDDILKERVVIRNKRQTTEYYIKWKGFEDSENQWVPSFNVGREAVREWKTKKKAENISTEIVQEGTPSAAPRGRGRPLKRKLSVASCSLTPSTGAKVTKAQVNSEAEASASLNQTSSPSKAVTLPMKKRMGRPHKVHTVDSATNNEQIATISTGNYIEQPVENREKLDSVFEEPPVAKDEDYRVVVANGHVDDLPPTPSLNQRRDTKGEASTQTHEALIVVSGRAMKDRVSNFFSSLFSLFPVIEHYRAETDLD